MAIKIPYMNSLLFLIISQIQCLMGAIVGEITTRRIFK